MSSRLLMTLRVAVEGPQKVGAVPHGTRVIAPIVSGQFEGPRLRGQQAAVGLSGRQGLAQRV